MAKRSSVRLPAKEWIISPQGRKALREGLKAIEKSERELAEARRVSWRDLHEPIYRY